MNEQGQIKSHFEMYLDAIAPNRSKNMLRKAYSAMECDLMIRVNLLTRLKGDSLIKGLKPSYTDIRHSFPI